MSSTAIIVEQWTSVGAATYVGSRPIQAAGESVVLACLPRSYYGRFIAEGSKARPNPIRRLEPFEHQPGMITLLAGKPNASVFPLTSFQFTARSPSDPEKEELFTISGPLLSQALQYGPTPGLPSMIEWLKGLQEVSHGRKLGEGWKLTIGSGSQDLLYKASSAVIQPGDYALIESPAYAGYIPVLDRLKVNIIPIDSDSRGIESSTLRNVLESWPESRPLPKILYTVPYGSNPSGTTTSIERRREVLALARKYEFLIFEDDPYFYLYYGTLPRLASYFALEREQPEVGRVVRFDSLSKMISGGFRIGFACGPEAIIEVMDAHTSISTLQASTFTQVIADTLLRSWGYEGFKKHTELAAEFYRKRRDKFEKALRLHLQGLAEWTSPDAGMFLWIKLLLKDSSISAVTQGNGSLLIDDPTAFNAVEGDSDSILALAIEKGVLPLPGVVFMPDGRKTPYVRVSVSQLDEDKIEEAVKRLAQAVEEVRKTRVNCSAPQSLSMLEYSRL